MLPSWNRASRANGGWRDASFVDDGKDIGKNLSGGWFDAGGAQGARVGVSLYGCVLRGAGRVEGPVGMGG